jgi:hypothetical protein
MVAASGLPHHSKSEEVVRWVQLECSGLTVMAVPYQGVQHVKHSPATQQATSHAVHEDGESHAQAGAAIPAAGVSDGSNNKDGSAAQPMLLILGANFERLGAAQAPPRASHLTGANFERLRAAQAHLGAPPSLTCCPAACSCTPHPTGEPAEHRRRATCSSNVTPPGLFC